MNGPDAVKSIIAKIETGKELTRRESMIYFTRVMNYTKKEAAIILNIARNSSPELIID